MKNIFHHHDSKTLYDTHFYFRLKGQMAMGNGKERNAVEEADRKETSLCSDVMGGWTGLWEWECLGKCVNKGSTGLKERDMVFFPD